jgi:hypothetical protein
MAFSKKGIIKMYIEAINKTIAIEDGKTTPR